MKTVFSKFFALVAIATPALGSFHLVHYSQLIFPQDEPDFFSAAIHEMNCGDLEHATIARSTNINDPLPDSFYPWFTVEFTASTCGVDMHFEQNGQGDFLVFRDGGGFEGFCRKGSGQFLNCLDIITSLSAEDDYFCDVPIC